MTKYSLPIKFTNCFSIKFRAPFSAMPYFWLVRWGKTNFKLMKFGDDSLVVKMDGYLNLLQSLALM